MICTKCDKELNEIKFSFRNKSKNIRHKICKSCQREVGRLHYEQNKQDYVKRAKVKNKEIDENIKKIILEAKSVPCMDCGNSYPSCVMDFDHVKGIKLGNVSTLVKNHSIKKIEEEIQKCEVVCANCHRLRTYNHLLVEKTIN
ncbi:MAG: hypothetical protein AB7O73_13745 [Bacteroidia bacterium]